MRISSRVLISVFAIAMIVGVFGVQQSNAQILSDILKTMEGHKNSLQSLKASVKMTEYEAALGDETVKNGDVSYVPRPGKDALVRIDWIRPDETLVVASGKYILYRKRLNQAIVGKVDDSKKQKGTNNALKFMSMSKKELQDNYEVVYLGQPTVGGVEAWHLKLTPKGPDSFKIAELWVDGNGMPIQAMIRQKNNDESTIRLSKIKKNEVIKTSVFKIDLKGVKIIDG
ncbi:MAG: outer membrane lipoprotein carrier protein LolA [Pyrinomonadaceae bacterium]|nr:outer membrane lipoprotein carrier protein LolA [Pyrinomonadaceae bacterium]